MEWSIFGRTGPTEKSGPPRKVDQFFRNFSGWTKPIHSVLDRNLTEILVEWIASIGKLVVISEESLGRDETPRQTSQEHFTSI